MAWLAGFALQGLDEGGFLTADVGARATTQDNKARLDDSGRLELGNGIFQNTVQTGYSSRK